MPLADSFFRPADFAASELNDVGQARPFGPDNCIADTRQPVAPQQSSQLFAVRWRRENECGDNLSLSRVFASLVFHQAHELLDSLLQGKWPPNPRSYVWAFL